MVMSSIHPICCGYSWNPEKDFCTEIGDPMTLCLTLPSGQNFHWKSRSKSLIHENLFRFPWVYPSSVVWSLLTWHSNALRVQYSHLWYLQAVKCLLVWHILDTCHSAQVWRHLKTTCVWNLSQLTGTDLIDKGILSLAQIQAYSITVTIRRHSAESWEEQ